MLNNFPNPKANKFKIHGIPYDLDSTKALAKKDRFGFEKWLCGEIGAHRMFHNPGKKDRDGGVDRIVQFTMF